MKKQILGILFEEKGTKTTGHYKWKYFLKILRFLDTFLGREALFEMPRYNVIMGILNT